ncbi:hypothetical protein SBRCBS47491_001767 [Sporothrix bragantina]|uniref:Ferric reductase NAD binding domain-containing protein n=1 Tax=Sporothrix bragantina TaxID=671064 RepID=A0ABP0B195_9PEZI
MEVTAQNIAGSNLNAAGSGPAEALTRATATTDLNHDSDKEMVEEKEHAVEKENVSRRNSHEDDANGETSAGVGAARTNVAADLEKATAAADAAAAISETNISESQPLRHSFSPGRPDAATVIRNAVSSTARSQRVLVAACGPPALMKAVRSATASCITSDGPSVELHCEQFGW